MALESTKKVLCLLTVGGALYLGYRASARVLQYVANKYYSSQKYVVIFYPTEKCPDTFEGKVVTEGNVVAVSLNRKVFYPTRAKKRYTIDRQNFELLSGDSLSMSFMCSTARGLSLYVLGGFSKSFHNLEKIYRCNLFKRGNDLFKSIREVECLENMKRVVFPGLIVRIDDDIYVLSLYMGSGDEASGVTKFVFMMYNIETDKWDIVIEGLEILDLYASTTVLHFDIASAPHVVIGSKLHVTLGAYSFTFDAKKMVWDKCTLFETFYSDPVELIGIPAVHDRVKKSDELSHDCFFVSPPFAFHRRGVIWENILLAVVEFPEVLLVAFLLEGEKVIKMQDLNLNIDGWNHHLVYLGQDGYFGLVRFVPQVNDFNDGAQKEYVWSVHLVVLKVTKVPAAESTYDHFLTCEIVGFEEIARNVYGGPLLYYNTLLCVID